MCRLDDVAGNNRRRDSGKLIAKIQNSSKCADAFSWSNQRGNRPSHGRGGGQSADRQADPKKRADSTVRVCRAENSQTERRSADEHGFTNAARAPTALYQSIHEPATNGKVSERGEEPGHSGKNLRKNQVNVDGGGNIRRQPGQEQIESVVVRRETQGQAAHFTLPKQVSEGSSFRGSRAILRLRSAPEDKLVLRGCQ